MTKIIHIFIIIHMLSTKDTTSNKTKKSYTFTLNQEQMEEFKKNNPNLNISGFLDTVSKSA